MRSHLRVARPPTLQALQRVLLAARASDLDQGPLPPGRSHTNGLGVSSSVMRRPRCIAHSLALEKLQQAGDRARMIIDPGMHIAELLEARRYRSQREIRRIAVLDLIPGERRRDAGIRRWPHRIRSGHGAIFGVLVVIDENALALLLPPFAAGEPRGAILHLASQSERTAAHFVEAPA